MNYVLKVTTFPSILGVHHGDSLSDKLMCGADDRPGRDRNRADARLFLVTPTQGERAAKLRTSGVNELYVSS